MIALRFQRFNGLEERYGGLLFVTLVPLDHAKEVIRFRFFDGPRR